MWILWSDRVKIPIVRTAYGYFQTLTKTAPPIGIGRDGERLDTRQRLALVKSFDVRLLTEKRIQQKVGASHARYQSIRISSTIPSVQLEKKSRRPEQEYT